MSHSGKPGTKETWTEISRPVATDWRSLKMKLRGHWHNSPCGPGRSRPWREPASPPSRRAIASKPSLPGSGPSRSSFETERRSTVAEQAEADGALEQLRQIAGTVPTEDDLVQVRTSRPALEAHPPRLGKQLPACP